MVKYLKLKKNQYIPIMAIYISFIFILMTFVIGPLVWPLGRCKQRASLRECTILLRKFMNIYGMLQKFKLLNNLV